MKQWKMAALVIALAAAAMVPAGSADAADQKIVLCTATMWAGQHTDVGTVVVSTDGEAYYVYMQTHSGWTMAQVHVHIAGSVRGVPHNKGGPIPGRFRYKQTVWDYRTELRIPCEDLPQGELLVLAHAEVLGPDGKPGDCTLELPLGTVEACISLDDRSYATHTISGAGAFDGIYEGWCVDVAGALWSDDCFDVTMISSLDPAAQGVINAPGNWDLINYLLNRVAYWRDGQGATFWDLQWVFWQLSDPGLPPSDGPDDQDLANRILADVLVNGEGFVPGHYDDVAIVIVHDDPDLQETIIPWRLDCPPRGGDETAWAGDLEFPGRNWARYFTCEGCR